MGYRIPASQDRYTVGRAEDQEQLHAEIEILYQYGWQVKQGVFLYPSTMASLNWGDPACHHPNLVKYNDGSFFGINRPPQSNCSGTTSRRRRHEYCDDLKTESQARSWERIEDHTIICILLPARQKVLQERWVGGDGHVSLCFCCCFVVDLIMMCD